MPEEETPHFGERRHPDDLGTTLGEQVVRCVPETFFDDVLPPNTMEERRVRAAMNELFPTRPVLAAEAADAQGHRGNRSHAQQTAWRVHATPKTTWSTRSQRKSSSSRRRRFSVRSRCT